MSECHYLVILGNDSLNFKLFSVLHLSKFCDSLGDLLVPLASDRRKYVFRTGNRPTNIISECA